MRNISKIFIPHQSLIVITLKTRSSIILRDQPSNLSCKRIATHFTSRKHFSACLALPSPLPVPEQEEYGHSNTLELSVGVSFPYRISQSKPIKKRHEVWKQICARAFALAHLP